MSKASYQSMEFIFEQFKNHTLSDSDRVTPLVSVFGLYAIIFMVGKLFNSVYTLLDSLILVVQKVGELSDAIVQNAPKFLAGFTTFFELLKALGYYIFCYILSPFQYLLNLVGYCLYNYLGGYYLHIAYIYISNGFKWPVEPFVTTPMLSDGSNVPHVVTPPRDSRNCHSFGRLNN